MGLIERIKSALGIGTSSSSPSGPSSAADRRSDGESEPQAEPTPASGFDEEANDVDVTVEHEPDARSEDAVKGTDTAGPGTSADADSAGEASAGVSTDEAPGAGSDEGTTETGEAEPSAADGETKTDAAAGAGVDLEAIKGIGPAYAQQLRDAGIEDVATLAAADAADLADRTDIGESRLQKLIDRAGAR